MRRQYLILALILTTLISTAFSNAAVKVNKPETCSADDAKCTAPNSNNVISDSLQAEASMVLEDAGRVQSATIEDIVQTEQQQEASNESGSPEDRASGVWNAAYKQWIEGSGGKNLKELSPSARRAIEEVRKRKAGESIDRNQKRGNLQDLEELEAKAGDSEVVLLSKAIARLSTGNFTTDDARSDLELVEYLCHSGDNGKHFESVGGVRVLLDLATQDGTKLKAVSALSTCAQNNPVVIDRCVADGAISALVSLAGEGTDILAGALRGLVALRVGRHVQTALLQHQAAIIQVLLRVLNFNVEDGRNERRAVLRSMALLEQMLRLNSAKWLPVLKEAGVMDLCTNAMKSTDEDVRESAAGVISAAASTLSV